MMDLKSAQLGRKKIKGKKACHDDLRKMLEKEYPKLASQDDAFELIRPNTVGSARLLSLILPSTDGYSLPYIRDIVGPTILIFIRPVQSNLSLDKTVTSNASSPLVRFHSCLKSLPLHVVRKHKELCQFLLGTDDNTADDSWMGNIHNSMFVAETRSFGK